MYMGMGEHKAVAVGCSGGRFTRRHSGRVEQAPPPSVGKGDYTGTPHPWKAAEDLRLRAPMRRIISDMKDIEMLVLFEFGEEEAMVTRYSQGTYYVIILKLISMFNES